jgi:capsular exopolysaccharide synthesis family protein
VPEGNGNQVEAGFTNSPTDDATMGRIAEALKKAQVERRAQLRVGLDERAAVQYAEPPLNEMAPTETDARHGGPGSNRISRAYAGLRRESLAAPRGLASAAPWGRAASPLGPAPAWDVHPSLVCVYERWSSVTEQYRAIRTWLLRRNTVVEHACLAITSAMPREGKSVTTANLAVAMAEVRHINVLAVDCDFRGSSLSEFFAIPNSPGLADVLAGRATLAEAIAKTPVGNLFVLPAGQCQDRNPTELLNSPMAARAFDQIRERHHYVLVDTPPVQRLSDVGVIGALCSGILMVVRMHKTPSPLVRQSLHWLQSNNLNVVGCIAAACETSDTRQVYGDVRNDE